MREKKYLIKSYKQMFLVITIFTLVLLVGGVSIAFFNYTRTGGANTIRVGRISFNHTQDGTITLTNIFPMTSEEFENSTIDPSNNVTINIEGDTTYPNGIEYLVTAEDVNITVNDKRIPLTLKVTSTTDLGDNDEDYFTNRGGSANIHKVLSGGVVVPGQYLVVGYIAPGQTGIDGSLNISAYINSDNIAISDTYDGTESDNMGTTSNWVNNRTVFTTEEWNSLSGSSNNLSFKIRVEANEGIWVEEATTPNLMNYININRSAVNIKEIRFIEETPLRMQRRYDASNVGNGTKADLTYQDTGKVLAWVEPITVNPTGTSSNLNIKPSFLVNENTNNNLKQIDNETGYILYIASSGKTKWTTASGLFGGFTTVEKITFENVDSSEVTSMSGMFPYLSNLKSIIGINKLDTSDVTDMSGMFNSCTNLVSIDLSGMGSNSLTNVNGMFSRCTNLTTINMSNFNFGTSNLGYNSSTSVNNSPFANLSNLTNINLKGANTTGVTDMAYMFGGCSSLTTIDLSGMGSNNLTSVGGMFSGCTSLTTINMSNFNFGITENLQNLYYIGSTNNIIEIKLNGSIMNSVTNMSSMFSGCTSLTSIDLSGLGSNNLTNVSSMFSNCTSLTNINMSNFNFGTASLDYIFASKAALQMVNLTNAHTENVTNMASMFDGNHNLSNIVGLNTLDTSSVTNMAKMFQGCSSLTSLNLNGLGSNVLTTTGDMLYGCTSLENVDMSNFNFGSVTSLGNNNTFRGLTNLKTVNLSNIKIPNVTGVLQMFLGCTNLITVNFTGVSFSNVTDFSEMFGNCINLEKIDLSSFNTSNATNMSSMFSGCTKLTTIYVSNTWNTNNVTHSNSMFSDCTSLVGGNGTVYDSSKTDKTMAVIDTASTPGYLTLKTS